MSKTIGLAIIGLGMWGKRMAAAVLRTDSLRLVTCYARDKEKRAAFAKEYNCQAAATFIAALEHPEVRGVLLVTPNHVHASQTTMCAQRGQPVFVEKPIAYTLEEAREMQAVCESAGVTLMVGHSFRRLGASRKVKEVLDSGSLGRVVLAEANFSLPGQLTPERWRYYRETCPGGGMMQLGIHHADTLQYWLGAVKSVQGSFARLVTEAEIDDVGLAQLEFTSGTRGTLTSSYVSPKTYSFRLYGNRAVLEYETDMSIWPNALQMDPSTRLTLRTDSGSESVSFEPRDMLMEELDEFAECILGNSQPETDAQEAINALQVVLAAIQSASTGERVTLEA